MKNILKFLTLILILISLTSFGQEKLGHINSQNLIDLMPDSKKATDELAQFEKELQEDFGYELTEEFQGILEKDYYSQLEIFYDVFEPQVKSSNTNQGESLGK